MGVGRESKGRFWETSGLQSQIGGGGLVSYYRTRVGHEFPEGTSGALGLAVPWLRDVTRGMTRVILRPK